MGDQAYGTATTSARRHVQKLTQLPPLPVVADQLLQVVHDENLSVARFAAIVERDPGLLARIVGLANAAYFAYPEKVTAAQQAILKVLGLTTAKSLALSIVLSGPFDPRRCASFDLDRYWSVAMMTAFMVRHLCTDLTTDGAPRPDSAYLAGLLHNIGMLALVHLYPNQMDAVLARRPRESGRLTTLVTEQLGADHHQVGGWIARKWHLPPPIVAVLENCADRDYQGDQWVLTRLVGCCARWANRRILGDEDTGAEVELRALGVSTDQFQEARKALEDKTEELAALARIFSSR